MLPDIRLEPGAAIGSARLTSDPAEPTPILQVLAMVQGLPSELRTAVIAQAMKELKEAEGRSRQL